MSLNFGKLNFSVSFNPTSAFPLDARSYFESYDAAVVAAQKAVPVGSSEAVYYYGQTLVVVENGKASFYIIQPDNSLSGLEGATSISVDEKLFEYDADGNLSLKGFDTAALGNVLSVGPNGTLVYSSVYTKTETDTKINEAVAAAAHLKRKIVDRKEDIDVDAPNADQYIYMVPSGLEADSNKFYEYMVLVIEDSEGTITKIVEQVGSWDVDLSDYATKTQINDLQTQVNDKVDKVEGSRLITEEEAEKLASLEPGLVKEVDSDTFEVSDSGKLILKDLPISKIIDLADILNKGKTTEGGYSLITATDKEKLSALTLSGETGKLEVSAYIDVSHVNNLADWITAHSSGDDYVVGLSENNLTDDLLEKLQSAITEEFISSADEEVFTVTSGKLGLNAIPISKVTNLDNILQDKIGSVAFAALGSRVSANENDLADLKDALTWGIIQ